MVKSFGNFPVLAVRPNTFSTTRINANFLPGVGLMYMCINFPTTRYVVRIFQNPEISIERNCNRNTVLQNV